MKVSEQHLARSELPALRCQRLFHLDDQLGAGKNLGGRVDDARAGRPVLLVRCADARAGMGLHQDGMTRATSSRTDCGTSPTRYSWS